MKKIVTLLILSALFIPAFDIQANASLVSDRKYRLEQKKENREAVKQIKSLINSHNIYANQHDIEKETESLRKRQFPLPHYESSLKEN